VCMCLRAFVGANACVDRLEALAGTLTVDSPAGDVTTIRAPRGKPAPEGGLPGESAVGEILSASTGPLGAPKQSCRNGRWP
jgi:hypothetical protein